MNMNFVNSLKHAVHGLVVSCRNEPNLRWQLLATGLVISLGLVVQLSRGEWLVITVIIGLVLMMELINTALEKTLDIIKPRFDVQVGRVKDILAGAVLVASIVATICGLLIFVPHLF